MKELEVLEKFSETMSRLTGLMMNGSDPFELLDSMEQTIEVVQEMIEIMGTDSPSYEECRQNLDNLNWIRDNLLRSL